MGSGFSSVYQRYLRRRPRQERSESVIHATIEATLQLLAKSDDDETVTVRQVAARAGIGAASFYDYFRDRSTLLRTAIAKLTEDNHLAFKAVLDSHAKGDLEDAVGAIVDLAFEKYLVEPKLSRTIMRLANRFGLMPMLAESQAQMARVIAKALGERSDVTVPDPQMTAYVLVQSMMGNIITLMWEEHPEYPGAQLRGEIVRSFVATLSAPRSTPPDSKP
jgi:AcrR family transcriptional regulator